MQEMDIITLSSNLGTALDVKRQECAEWNECTNLWLNKSGAQKWKLVDASK